MRATIVIDDDLFAKAQKFAGGAEKSAAVREALEAFVERGAARRLPRMDGRMPETEASPRRFVE
ncbi:MAG TPA: type II toxin-antitoxin system VapB family antitoxin [Bradyrhizobium sp.]|jgi:Arc/MetJ family transcription regulator